MDFMKLFLTDELVQQNVDDTNLHADNTRATTGMKGRSGKKDWNNVLHGHIHLPKLNDYWRQSRGYAQDFYRGLMGQDTFLNILRFWFSP